MSAGFYPGALLRAAALTLAVTGGATQAGGDPAPLPPGRSTAVPPAGAEGRPTDQLIVKYRDDTAALPSRALSATLPRTAATLARLAVQVQDRRPLGTRAQVLKLSRALPLAEAARLARDLAADDASIDYAEPDRLLTRQAVPTDPRYGEQWHYFEPTGGINAPAAWDRATGAGVVVAVLDTGVRPHADLLPNLLPGYDFIATGFVANDGDGRDADASDPGDAVQAGECGGGQPVVDEPSSWHGTHVAGTVAAAADGRGVVGVAHGAKLLPVRVLGRCGGYTSDIAEAIVWAAGGSVAGVPANPRPARVINLSLGGPGGCAQTTQAAIDQARSRGAVVVVAAGNSAQDAAQFSPASCRGVVTVAATTREGGRAYYSNHGATVELSAPGGEAYAIEADGVLSTLNTGHDAPAADGYAYYQGTSMAAPHVSGVAALVLERAPGLAPDAVGELLAGTARAFPAACDGCGRGIVDAAAAVTAAAGGGDTGLAEIEPNDRRIEAQVVAASGTTVDGSMSRRRDRDVYAVSVAAGRTLAVALTPTADADYDLFVYGSDGRLIGRSLRAAGEVDTVTLPQLKPGSYYAEVRYYSGGTGAQAGRYTLQLMF
ncbi:S8 family serine peptidase [Schlegelella sp. S2-27]|uniref:S8 family serine peptidase n=1 Tax=Caldimonas mangrovi TaxID=2944811 RepID=A0ABT0YSZ0_9BURK|nr:S8 family peptidase [Caldimonas mangrovi]MCM5681863.1 S8 family serine peptidase [Caldimonas mangrovi]